MKHDIIRIYELRQKEIINVRDGTRFGYAADVELCQREGKIINLIVPGPGRLFGVFGRNCEYCIPWAAIKKMGDDIILVDVKTKDCLKEF
ncbi:MAG: YlmC/YmxH family sporulation protein [Defluviitaleaceae bacterium]|nr:YlmC/YmxH family sporulation protein [Defluviitaleaceae bacterium]